VERRRGKGTNFYLFHKLRNSSFFVRMLFVLNLNKNQRKSSLLRCAKGSIISLKCSVKCYFASFNRPYVLPNVPAVVARLLFGGVADLLLNGSAVSCAKLTQQFHFKHKFPTLESALKDLAK
jgi:NAD dependent epimerase/dehydratase family enzyme